MWQLAAFIQFQVNDITSGLEGKTSTVIGWGMTRNRGSNSVGDSYDDLDEDELFEEDEFYDDRDDDKAFYKAFSQYQESEESFYDSYEEDVQNEVNLDDFL